MLRWCKIATRQGSRSRTSAAVRFSSSAVPLLCLRWRFFVRNHPLTTAAPRFFPLRRPLPLLLTQLLDASDASAAAAAVSAGGCTASAAATTTAAAASTGRRAPHASQCRRRAAFCSVQVAQLHITSCVATPKAETLPAVFRFSPRSADRPKQASREAGRVRYENNRRDLPENLGTQRYSADEGQTTRIFRSPKNK